MILDKEMEALVKCTDLIKELDDEAKVRVVKYLIEKFGIGFQRNQPFERTSPTQSEPAPKQINESKFDEPIEYVEEVKSNDYPTLKDLMIKDYPKSEAEWVLCYAFYSSKYGNETFNRDDISEKYKENNRFSDSAKANLGNNINACVKKDWIKSVNNTDFVLKPDGVKYAKQILSGNSIGKEKKPVKRKPKKVENE